MVVEWFATGVGNPAYVTAAVAEAPPTMRRTGHVWDSNQFGAWDQNQRCNSSEHTVRYTELAPHRFRDFWDDW